MLRFRSLAFTASFLLALGACGKKEEAPQEPVIKPIKIYTVVGGDTIRLEYPGQVSATLESVQAFEVSGKIVKFPVVEGQDVKRGELMAQLDMRDYQSNFDAAKSEFERAESNFKRAEELIKGGFVSQADYDTLKATRSQAKANMDRAEKALDDATLRAPFDGKIARKLVDIYNNVQAKEGVLVLHNLDDLEVVINIPESDWARVSRARSKTMGSSDEDALNPLVEIAGFPGRSFPAVTREVSTTANPTTRTYEIKLGFKVEGDEVILPGMTAKAFVEVPAQVRGSALMVPVNSVSYDDEGKAFVWIYEPAATAVTKREVEVGQMSGSSIEVLKGLQNGDQVASSGVSHLREGMKVREFK
ncbi:efflux RND transporter periplasmic adaptor subunit [Agaribacterium haliotis]|uniref:efflux RND transporter periplasmic adaptor subunit n=1 Tax=Agaribacterium haliotis TaxID=2013869 RepID=UPI000BB59C9F|nr:efflux RND transporter periplasmic adaptor subunit [Agaribacterium haliotis]